MHWNPFQRLLFVIFLSLPDLVSQQAVFTATEHVGSGVIADAAVPATVMPRKAKREMSCHGIPPNTDVARSFQSKPMIVVKCHSTGRQGYCGGMVTYKFRENISLPIPSHACNRLLAPLQEAVPIMKPFEFHAELFELPNAVLEALADAGFAWLSDFGSIDLQHDVCGLEVTGIREEKDAKAIKGLLRRMFPKWRYCRKFYEDRNLGELGWKVMISRDPEDYDDDWQRAS